MQAMDRQYLDTPFYGSRRMKVWLEREGRRVSRKRVQRLMRIMGLRAIYRSTRASRPAPEIFNTDQGNQFTSLEFTHVLQEHGVKISMDGKGRYTDNIFVERLWRTVKYEQVYLKAYAYASEARRELGSYFRFYNDQRPHQALGYRTPAEVFHQVTVVGEERAVRRRSLQ